MNSLVALELLGQIIRSTLSSQVRGDLECNDKDAKEWTDVGVRYINEHKLHGYKYALNGVDWVAVFHQHVDRNWVAVFLKLNLLETECHVLDPTPVKNCTIRTQHNHAVEMDCDVKIMFNVATFKEDVFVKCHSTPDSVENVWRNCPKCPILLPSNHPQVVDSVEYVLNKHNEQLSGHVYEVLEISRGQHKHIGFCRATVFRSHASLEKPKDEQFESDCVILDVKEGHAHSHLIQQHVEKDSISPEHNNTALNLVHPHNDTSTSHESHEHLAKVLVAFVKKELSKDISDHHTTPVEGCPGKVLHFEL